MPLIVLAALMMALGAAFVGCAAGDGLAGRQLPRTFEGEIRKRVRLDYLLYLPEAYADGSKRWPLMLFLHGVGERGDELERVKLHGPPMLIEQGRSFPCIVVSPQCPAWQWWAAEPAALAALLDEIERDFRVDPDRIYLTGLSMGGAGTWALAAEQPHRFAAIAPVCGPTNPGTADRIRHLPVWVFHGAKDTTVPLRESETMVEALRALGAEPRLTVYPEAGHDAWTETYANPELYEWLFAQRRAR